MGSDAGFIAALDQSGGSTPKALKLYGVDESAYSNDDEMFDVVHAMRTRIMTNPSFNSDRILGAILFQNTLDREVAGMPTSEYLWREKRILPILKIDYGMADEADGVQVMKPIPDLAERLPAAKAKSVFGTKMRSVIHSPDEAGIARVVEQQFAFADEVRGHGLVPIIEPEVDIHAEDKAACEAILKDRAPRRSRRSRRRGAGDVQAHPARRGEPLPGVLLSSQGAARRGVVGRLLPGGVEPETRGEQRHDRELLPGVDRGPARRPGRCRLHRHARRIHRLHRQRPPLPDAAPCRPSTS